MKASKKTEESKLGEGNGNHDNTRIGRDGKEVTKKSDRGTGKKTVGGVGSSSREQCKRGRKTGWEHMKTLIDAYMATNPPEVRAQITGWERELNDNMTNQDIPMEEWEDMVQDPSNTRSRHTLFRQTIQQYWVMKNVVARAMTLNKE